jgi:glycosyltransferase involved in cell wall biosynthesis
MNNTHESKKVSTLILMPVLNESMYIHQAIDSIVSQSFTDWVLLAQDNCSDDNTLEILHSYALTDDRIKVIESETRLTASENWIKIYDYAQLKFSFDSVCFFAGDDFWKESTYLELIRLDLLKSANRNVAFPSFSFHDVVNNLEERFQIEVTAESTDERINIYIRNWRNVNMQYGLFSAEYFNKLMNDPVSKFTDYVGADWWWSLAIVIDQSVSANNQITYVKRTNKKPITADVRFAITNLIQQVKFVNHHLTQQSHRLESLSVDHKIKIISFTVKCWLSRSMSASRHLLIFLFGLSKRPKKMR